MGTRVHVGSEIKEKKVYLLLPMNLDSNEPKLRKKNILLCKYGPIEHLATLLLQRVTRIIKIIIVYCLITTTLTYLIYVHVCISCYFKLTINLNTHITVNTQTTYLRICSKLHHHSVDTG